MTGGGIVHGPTPRDYAQRTPKKMIAAALLGALSRPRPRRAACTSSSRSPSARPPRPRPSSSYSPVSPPRSTSSSCSSATTRSALKSVRNIPTVHVLHFDQLNAYDVLVSDDIVFTKAALEAFVAREDARPEGRGERVMSRRQQGPARHHHRAGRLREELRPDRRGQVHLPRRPPLEQDRDQARHREDLQGRGRVDQHPEPSGQDPPHQVRHRQAQGHQARDRHAEVRFHRHLHGSRLRPGSRGKQTWLFASTSPRPRVVAVRRVADFAEITRSTPEKSLLRPLLEDRWPQQPGPHHDPSHRWWPQAPVPRHRLPSQRQGRRQRQGRSHRVRPQPHGAHRAAALRRRHEALHPRAEQAVAGRHRRVGCRRGHQAGQQPAAAATSRPVPSSTRSS